MLDINSIDIIFENIITFAISLSVLVDIVVKLLKGILPSKAIAPSSFIVGFLLSYLAVGTSDIFTMISIGIVAGGIPCAFYSVGQSLKVVGKNIVSKIRK